MPLHDGFAATRLVRKQPELHDVPIVAISALEPSHFRTVALAAGCNEYVTKPPDFDQLEHILRRLLSDVKAPRPRLVPANC